MTLEYDAFSVPDRFVVEVGGQVVIDTRYVGSSNYTVTQVNNVLDRYGFRRTSQPSIITPGGGTVSFEKSTNSTSAVVRVYAPLPGTQWKVTLKFRGSSCGGTSGIFGAMAYGRKGSKCSYTASIVFEYSDRNEAKSAAINLCRQSGGRNCVTQEFGSAFAGNHQCGALADGERGMNCKFRFGPAVQEPRLSRMPSLCAEVAV